MAAETRLNEEQQEAFKALLKFIKHPATDTFVLKGYAGTGKTFLMQHLAKWLDEKEYKFSLLASTGRAAAVLRGKTGLTTKTLHSELYNFSKANGAEDDLPEDAPMNLSGQFSLLFSLRAPDEGKRIYIVDESSMLSDEISDESSILNFGTNNLLLDFFTAAGKNKIIFVGDPGQLPPVKKVFSPALDMHWLAREQRTGIGFTLTKIERNNADNGILLLASAIRSMLDKQDREPYPKLPASNTNNVNILTNDKTLFYHYVARFKEVGHDKAIAIARSNRMVNHINRAVRRELFGGLDLSMQDDDVLLVTNNNYAVPLANGDFVMIRALGPMEVRAGLHFQQVKIKALLSDTEFELLVSLDILYGQESNFTKEQLEGLMLDFNRRMKRKNINMDSEAYREAMMSDRYLNCLRAKFGYAVTCHKAQGGEWDEVFLFLEKSMYAMPHTELLRWWYTAVTRARGELFLANNWWIK
jgi:ATP-dependent exoDNAse (exonuclease V) alpha subunit